MSNRGINLNSRNSLKRVGTQKTTWVYTATPPPNSLWTCPQYGGPMIILERLSAAQITLRSPPLPLARKA